ncbi:hypothetical protein RND71_027103 [Anisodus tanguticus]|uniref:Uncharacterized protein n=1 Tax=Anisodus tanguticus TaxID=243964 RepID=A0AAE1VB42_9SOLA|nr:hypothetical protein RND71_027103 [Anisodus tanguticus]
MLYKATLTFFILFILLTGSFFPVAPTRMATTTGLLFPVAPTRMATKVIARQLTQMRAEIHVPPHGSPSSPTSKIRVPQPGNP